MSSEVNRKGHQLIREEFHCLRRWILRSCKKMEFFLWDRNHLAWSTKIEIMEFKMVIKALR